MSCFDYNYIVAGKISKGFNTGEYPNLKFVGYLSDEELLNLYRKAKVYCQLSEHEGFGISVAEAMACECIPVVSNKGALPEIVDSNGFIVSNNLIDSIKKASKSNMGKHCRKSIVERFDLNIREKKLIDLMEKIK